MLLTLLVFLAAMVLPFALPHSDTEPRSPVVPVAAGVFATLAIMVGVIVQLEDGGPFSGMANFFVLGAGLNFLALTWSIVAIVVSLVPSWRAKAKCFLVPPVFFAICMASLMLFA